ncbi:NADPH-dependent F420 reductase [Streptomyces sp. NPDC055157]
MELVKRRDRIAHRTHHRKVGSMKIGIIGAGNIGGNLTRRLTALGHEVSIANSRGPQTLTALAEETGATPVTAAEAAQGARVVVITIPVKAVPKLPAGFLNGAAEDVAVIDTGNYYPQQRDDRLAAIENGLPESRWTEEQVGHPVIKAFNGTYADDILSKALPKGSPGRQALPVAGDDAAAKQTVRDLIDELGFDTVDAGGLDESWRQQPGTPVYGNQGDAETIAKALAEASPERTAEWRA